MMKLFLAFLLLEHIAIAILFGLLLQKRQVSPAERRAKFKRIRKQTDALRFARDRAALMRRR